MNDTERYIDFEAHLPSYVESLIGHIILCDVSCEQQWAGGCSKWTFDQIHCAEGEYEGSWVTQASKRLGVLVIFDGLTLENSMAWANLGKRKRRLLTVIEKQVREALLGEARPVNGKIIRLK